MQKGLNFGQSADLNPHTKFVPPRIKDNNTFDDILFHTHPWNKNDPIKYYREPINSCRESDTDLSSLLAERMIEEESGIDREVTSIISSRGFINIMVAKGVRVNEEVLVENGPSGQAILEIKRSLSLAPEKWVLKFAKNPAAAKQFMDTVQTFYKARESDRSITYPRMVNNLRSELISKKLIDPRELEGFIDELKSHLPHYPSATQLSRLGLSPEQIKLVMSMLGIRKSIKQLSDGGTMMQVE